jgi:hypothetical protein
MPNSPEDKKQIGLTASGDAALAELMDYGLFAKESDAYKLAIAYALAKGMDPSDAPDGGYTTKFNAGGGLDIYNEIRDLIIILRPQDEKRPYASAERLAELGLVDLAMRLKHHEGLADILGAFKRDIQTLEGSEVSEMGES